MAARTSHVQRQRPLRNGSRRAPYFPGTQPETAERGCRRQKRASSTGTSVIVQTHASTRPALVASPIWRIGATEDSASDSMPATVTMEVHRHGVHRRETAARAASSAFRLAAFAVVRIDDMDNVADRERYEDQRQQDRHHVERNAEEGETAHWAEHSGQPARPRRSTGRGDRAAQAIQTASPWP